MRHVISSQAGLVIAAGLVVATHASAKPLPCPSARYLITQGAEAITSDSAPQPAAVVLQGKQIGLGANCGLHNGSVKASKKGTKLKAKWPTCGTLEKVKLSATIQTDCVAMAGK